MRASVDVGARPNYTEESKHDFTNIKEDAWKKLEKHIRENTKHKEGIGNVKKVSCDISIMAKGRKGYKRKNEDQPVINEGAIKKSDITTTKIIENVEKEKILESNERSSLNKNKDPPRRTE